MTKPSQPPPFWLSPQQSLLALMTLAISMALIHSIQPSANRTTSRKYEFPEDVPLPGWLPAPLPVEADSKIAEDLEIDAALPSGTEVAMTRYVYRSSPPRHLQAGRDEDDWDAREQLLTIEMRYFTQSNGDAKSHIHQISGDVQSALQHRAGVGSYGLYADGDRVYTTACINPAGGSTVLSDDYRSNRYRYDFRFARIGRWALGRGAIQDRRCLWVHMSMEQNDLATSSLTSSTGTVDGLEMAWLDWFRWWTENYPNS